LQHDLVGGRHRDPIADAEAEGGEAVSIPSVGAAARRFGDDQSAADPEEGRTALRGRSRRRKATGHDHVELAAEGTVGRQFGPFAHDVHAIAELETSNGAEEKLGAGPAPL
jgi:hypothetical protein